MVVKRTSEDKILSSLTESKTKERSFGWSLMNPNAAVPASEGVTSLDQMQNGPAGVDLRNSLAPLVFVSQFTSQTFFFKTEGKRLHLIACYRILIFASFILCLLHELPTIKFWMSSARGLHAMLACVETWYRWTILFVNFALNVLNSARIADAISLLVELPITMDKTTYNTIYRFQIFIIVFNLILIVCYMGLGHDSMWVNSNYTWYTSTIYIVTEFYIGFSNVQFVGILYAIQKYFRTVNDHLRKFTFKIDGLRDGRTLIFLLDGSHKQDSLLDIVKFRELHLNLSCICSKLNECYTVQILLFLVMCMIEITYSLRSCMLLIVTSDDKLSEYEWRHKPWLEIMLTIFWGGYYFINLIELVSSCDCTASESRQTSVVVHELINKVQDKNLERQLQLFSLQLMNHAASFTAGRFFQLDFALLHSIIGAITTYLVIIITFRE